MSWNDLEKEDTNVYSVVVNHEQQYSIWPQHKETPPGWEHVGKAGAKADCLAYVKEVWTDMRPLSLRERIEELARTPPRQAPPAPAIAARSLVDRLSDGDHPVEAGFGSNKSLKLTKEAIDRGYAHITFPTTKGGSSLGVRLDRDACNLAGADFEAGAGTVHLEGELTLDFVKVRCSADIDLSTLNGKGRLTKIGSHQPN
jgi:uncharacterized protein YbdZ (MbtH family)